MPWALIGKAKSYFFYWAKWKKRSRENFRQLMFDNRFFVERLDDWLAKKFKSLREPEEAQATLVEAIRQIGPKIFFQYRVR